MVPITEELAVKRKRQKMADGFAKYLGKTAQEEKETEGGDDDDVADGGDSMASSSRSLFDEFGDFKPGAANGRGNGISGLKPAAIR